MRGPLVRRNAIREPETHPNGIIFDQPPPSYWEDACGFDIRANDDLCWSCYEEVHAKAFELKVADERLGTEFKAPSPPPRRRGLPLSTGISRELESRRLPFR